MKKLLQPLALCAALLAGLGLSTAHAAGTASGTSISNTATVNYTVGGVSQSPVVSAAASFAVDTKVSMTMVPKNGAGSVINVISGATRQVIPFTLTNTGNLVNDYGLSITNLANGTTYGAYTDNFDGASCSVFADANGNGTYESATDTATYVDELAPDASTTAFIVCDISASRANADFSALALTATAKAGGSTGTQGATLVASAGAKVLGTVAIVFADAAGTDDAASDGVISSRSGYLVQTATVTATKSVAAYCDPVNFNTNPKLVPGSFARYTITLSNAAGATASAVVGNISDTLVAQLGFDANLINATASACSTPTSAAGKGIKVSCTGGMRACVATPQYLTTTSFVSGQVMTVNMSTVLPVETGYAAGEIKPGESVQLIFNAIVQ